MEKLEIEVFSTQLIFSSSSPSTLISDTRIHIESLNNKEESSSWFPPSYRQKNKTKSEFGYIRLTMPSTLAIWFPFQQSISPSILATLEIIINYAFSNSRQNVYFSLRSSVRTTFSIYTFAKTPFLLGCAPYSTLVCSLFGA